MLMFGMATTLFWAGDANSFLKGGTRVMAEHVRAEDIEAVLSSELAEALGGGLAEAKLVQLEEVLWPMFSTLPKNEHGNVGRAAVRYALHRFFVGKHGWFVKGLEPAEAGQNASSPTAMLKDNVPSYVEALFEQHLGGRGFGLRQLAVLAATLEHLVHDEAMGRLQASYQAHKILPTDLVNQDEAKEIIAAYLASFIFGTDLSEVSLPQLERLKRGIAKKSYSGWRDTRVWLKDMQFSVQYVDRGVSNPFVLGDLNFPAIAHVVEEVDDRHGRFQGLQCKALKNRLVDREERLPGRVLLSDFYRKGLQGFFTESVEYLRELGALDESDPKMPPSVVVPNYINAKTNCMGESSFYLLCCIDECEGLMGHLEREITMPTAEPQRIAALVASMPSDTMVAPRNLSTALLSRLDAIAERHAGRVPLHGRLFAQWMHHAYPNECQYPQAVAETSTQAASTEAPKTMPRKDRALYADRFSVEVDELLVDNYDLPWTDVENLLDEYHKVPTRAAEYGLGGFVFNLALLLALLSMVVSIARTSKSTVASLDSASRSAKFEKYSV